MLRSSATFGNGGSIDVALLPIGAYEPRWFMRSVQVNPAEAVQAHLDLETSESIGMHFGTLQMTTEGIDEPLRALVDSRRTRDVRRRSSGPFISANQCGSGNVARHLELTVSCRLAISVVLCA
jgi:L-ascorbate metabolism protein UlaG (beta-lactamase superfamily)